MTRAQQRAVALSCARYQLRQLGVDPLEVSAEDAHAALEAYGHRSPEMEGSQWYLLSLDRSCRVHFCKVSATHTGVNHDIKWPPRQQLFFLEISSVGWTFQDELFSGEESRRELVYRRFQPSCWFPSRIRLLVKASSPMTDLLVEVEAVCARGPRHARSS